MQHWIKLDINATTSVLSFKYNPTAIAILFCFSTQEEEKQNKNKKDNTILCCPFLIAPSLFSNVYLSTDMVY